MKIAKICGIVLFLSFVGGSSAQSTVGQYRGHQMAGRLLSERLLEPAHPLYFFKYVDGQNDLLTLLGDYSFRGDNAFINGTPNSTNMLVWHLVLQSFADEVGANCGLTKTLQFQPFFRSLLETACRWPSPEAQAETTMQAFWLSIMGYDAPEEEFFRWREFFLSSSFAGKTAAETIPALVLSIVYNPHFLLRK